MSTPLDNHALSDALVILGAAGIVIPTFARFRISPVIGFILVGILVGPAVLGELTPRWPWLYYVTISDPHAIEPFAEFGITLLLFLIGMELSFRRLWTMRTEVFGIGGAELIGSAVLIGGVLLLTLPWTTAVPLGLALALSSTALVLPIAGTTSPTGRSAFAMLLLEDLALVPIIFLTGALGVRPGGGSVLGTLLWGALAVAAIFVLGRVLLPRLFAQAARTKSPELFFAISLLVVIAASLATSAAGLSPIVGALLAGLLIAETDYHHEVEVIIKPFQGLALGVFLITVGMGLDLRALIADWPSFVLALLGVVAAKAFVTAALLAWSGVRKGVAAETALLMASPSETTLIVLGTATGAGLLAGADAAFWQTVTALGLTITPLLAQAGRAVARRIEAREGSATEDLQVAAEGPGAVVIGFGRVGRMVAEMLREHDQRFTAVEADIDAVKAARQEGWPVIFGDVNRAELVDKLNLGRATALVLTMDDPALTVRLARRVRGWAPDLTIVARARDAAHAAELYKAGVTDAVPETLESSLQLSEAVLVDLGIAMGPVIASVHEKRDVLRREIRDAADMTREPRLRRVRAKEVIPPPSAP